MAKNPEEGEREKNSEDNGPQGEEQSKQQPGR